MNKPNLLHPPSNCVVHEDDVDWGGELFLLALDISPTKTYIYSMKERGNMIKVDKRSKDSVYITIGKWVIYIDNSTGEHIIESWEE